jgi:hypothetical protein
MAKLCAKGKAAAKRKFKVYPSAYANMYASGVCSGKITPGGKRQKKNEGGPIVSGSTNLRKTFRKLKEPVKSAMTKVKGPAGDNARKMFDLKSKQYEKLKDIKEKKSTRPTRRKKMMGGGRMMPDRVMLKSGGMCKLASKGKGRAYGKNS